MAGSPKKRGKKDAASLMRQLPVPDIGIEPETFRLIQEMASFGKHPLEIADRTGLSQEQVDAALEVRHRWVCRDWDEDRMRRDLNRDLMRSAFVRDRLYEAMVGEDDAFKLTKLADSIAKHLTWKHSVMQGVGFRTRVREPEEEPKVQVNVVQMFGQEKVEQIARAMASGRELVGKGEG